MMKTLLITSLLVFASVSMVLSQNIIIDENGTVKCEGAPVGTTETIDGDTYEVVDRELLDQRIDEGADLSLLCVSNVTDMSALFYMKIGFDEPLGNWDVSNVTNMGGMFGYTDFSHPLDNWDVSKVTNMAVMFTDTNFNHPLSSWDVSSVTDMRAMFTGTPFNQDIGDWDVSSVTDMHGMFFFSEFNQPVGNWDVSSVETLNSMFRDTPFNQPIGSWDVSNVQDMGRMFQRSAFNQPLEDWDVSAVTQMGAMFLDSTFGKSVNKWCVAQIPTKPSQFENGSEMIPEFLPDWGTCPGLLSDPVLVSPENETTIESLEATLAWTTVNEAETCRIQVSSDLFATLVVDEEIGSTGFTTAELSEATEYRWRIQASNSAGLSYWTESWAFTTPVVSSTGSDELPDRFVLNQNYPNPFNPATLITFSVPQTSNVRFDVYTVSGQLVQTLVNETMSAGNLTVKFSGETLSSGVYIYRLTTPEFSEARMMSLVK